MNQSSSAWFRRWVHRLETADLEQCEMWIIAEIGDRIERERRPFEALYAERYAGVGR